MYEAGSNLTDTFPKQQIQQPFPIITEAEWQSVMCASI